jgi:hypothetical protein
MSVLRHAKAVMKPPLTVMQNPFMPKRQYRAAQPTGKRVNHATVLALNMLKKGEEEG